MAPDLEMRLSFPKRSPLIGNNESDTKLNNDQIEESTLNVNQYMAHNTVENSNHTSNRPSTKDEFAKRPLNATNPNRTLTKGHSGENTVFLRSRIL